MAGPGQALMAEKYKRSRPIGVLLRTMFSYLGKFRNIIYLGAFLAIVATIFMAIDPLVLSWGIDLVLEDGTDINGIILLAVIFINSE